VWYQCIEDGIWNLARVDNQKKMLHGAEKSNMASKVTNRADNIKISLILTKNFVNNYEIDPTKYIYDTFKLGKYFKFKMATKTDIFRISHRLAKLWAQKK